MVDQLLDAIGTVLAALGAMSVFVLIVGCGVVWSSRRRMDQAAERMASEAQKQDDGSGPH